MKPLVAAYDRLASALAVNPEVSFNYEQREYGDVVPTTPTEWAKWVVSKKTTEIERLAGLIAEMPAPAFKLREPVRITGGLHAREYGYVKNIDLWCDKYKYKPTVRYTYTVEMMNPRFEYQLNGELCRTVGPFLEASEIVGVTENDVAAFVQKIKTEAEEDKAWLDAHTTLLKRNPNGSEEREWKYSAACNCGHPRCERSTGQKSKSKREQ